MQGLSELLTSDIVAIGILVVVLVGTAHTGVLQVREFRDRTGEDSYFTRIFGLTLHKPRSDRFEEVSIQKTKPAPKTRRKRVA